MAGLYIHIPFCRRKCAYCDFVSFADRVDFLPYTAALITEMRLYSPLIKDGKKFDTVFIGGGTPYYMGIIDGAYYLTEHRVPGVSVWRFLYDNGISDATHVY